MPSFVSLEFMCYGLQLIWWPTFISWIAMSILDTDLMREFFMIAVLFSFSGPFFLYFVGLADLMIKAVEMKLGRRVDWWLTFIGILVGTVGSIFYQIILIPRVMHWLVYEPIATIEEPTETDPFQETEELLISV